MKHFFFFITLIISTFIFGQKSKTAFDASFPLIYQDVITSPDISADILYKKMLEWSADYFKDSDEAITYKDSELRLIKGKSNFILDYNGLSAKSYSGRITFNFKFEAKEGKMRYTFDNFRHNSVPGLKIGYFSFGLITIDEECPVTFNLNPRSSENKFWKKVKEDIDTKMKQTIATIELYIKSIKMQDDNW